MKMHRRKEGGDMAVRPASESKRGVVLLLAQHSINSSINVCKKSKRSSFQHISMSSFFGSMPKQGEA